MSKSNKDTGLEDGIYHASSPSFPPEDQNAPLVVDGFTLIPSQCYDVGTDTTTTTPQASKILLKNQKDTNMSENISNKLSKTLGQEIQEQSVEYAKIIEKSNETTKLYNDQLKCKPVDSKIISQIQEILFGEIGGNIKFSDAPVVVLDEEKKVLELGTKRVCEIFDIENIDMESVQQAISEFIKMDLKRFDNPTAYIQHILVVRNERNMDYQTGEPIENSKPSIEVMIKMAYDQEVK